MMQAQPVVSVDRQVRRRGPAHASFPGVVVWLLLLVLPLQGLAGCYGSTRPIAKIGLIAPFEELYREDGYAALWAVQLAVAERNAAGGVAGHDVVLVALNDDARPQESITQAAKLGRDVRVVGVVGPVSTAGGRAAAARLASEGLPWVSIASMVQGPDGTGFSLSARPEVLGQVAVVDLAGRGVTGRVLLYGDSSLALAAAQAAGAAHGMAVEAGSPTGDLEQDVNGAIWLGDAAGGARLASALAGRPLAGGPDLGSPVFAGRAGEAAAGAHWLSSGPALADLPPGFVDGYRALAGSVPGPQAVLAYDAANLLLDGLDAAGREGSLERPAVLQAVRRLVSDGWHGLSGLVLCDPAGNRLEAPVRAFSWDRPAGTTVGG